MWLYVVYTGTAVGRGWKMDFSRAFKKTCNDLKCGGKGTQWIYEFKDKSYKNNELDNLNFHWKIWSDSSHFIWRKKICQFNPRDMSYVF